MQLTPWRKPIRRDMTRSKREMNSLWNDFLAELQPFEGFGEEWLPSMDVTESDTEILVRAELPGVEAKDIGLNISGDILTVRGEKKEEAEKKKRSIFPAKVITGLLSGRSAYPPRPRWIMWRPNSKTVFCPSCFQNPKIANQKKLR